VQIGIRRRGYAESIPLEVTRDEVQILTVPAAFMIDGTTGYIRHQDWGENTDREIRNALRDLRAKGMKRLLYDIRANPGGPLTQAIKVSSVFLKKGEMVVYTRGRVSNSSSENFATEESEFTDVPMVVLANRNSASASEIFTGALQDHDRAYLVGETTFGKALVQSVYPISGGAALALTTAHYYTPRGRLIQRPWDETFDEYLSYTQRDQDVKKAHNPGDLKYTDAGRPVYSGGGIEPDKYVAGPTGAEQGLGFATTSFGRGLFYRQEFENFAVKFDAVADKRVAQQPAGRVGVAPNFVVDDAMVADFVEHLKASRVKIDEDGFAKDRDFIKAMIRYRIDETLFGKSEALRRIVSVDPQVQAGLASFVEAERLPGLAKPPVRAQ
jgi:carboxyl-terminal processing protease